MFLSTLTGFFFQSFYQILAENHGTEHIQFLLISKANITMSIFFQDRVTTLIGVNEFQNELNLFCQPTFIYVTTYSFSVHEHCIVYCYSTQLPSRGIIFLQKPMCYFPLVLHKKKHILSSTITAGILPLVFCQSCREVQPPDHGKW